MNKKNKTSASASASLYHDESKQRQPWLRFSLFTSSHRQRHRSQSLDAGVGMPLQSRKHSGGGFASLFNKASHNGLRRTPTAGDLNHSGTRKKDSSKSKRNAKNEQTASADRRPSEPSHYLLSANEDEADRIRQKNDLLKLAFGSEFVMPIDLDDLESGRVLDIGCGPGSWCIDLAEDYPHIQVIGIDSVDMFSDQFDLPSNCVLIQHNVLKGLDQFPAGYFDYIHIRLMSLAFTADQYKTLIKDCWRILKPGTGCLEMMEMDMTVYSPGPHTSLLNAQVIETAQSRGLMPELARRLESFLPNDAIVKVVKYQSLPIGLWGGRLGVMFREDLFRVLIHSRNTVNDYLGKDKNSDKEFELDLETAVRELEIYHSFSNFHFVVAQKSAERTAQTASVIK